jgi:transglutaminase-like putative cysteine protease
MFYALVLASAFPTLLCAQFQEPSSEELKMTADPKAPGAAAVYLYREEKTDDQASLHSFYERIKVLTEKGTELATVKIPYEYGKFQIAAIQGRTIHADGTVIPLKAKPSDLLDFKNSGHQYRQMVFTLPDAQVGSILEYRLLIHYGDNEARSPQWIIQRPYFVHKAHYSFDPAYNTGHIVTNSRGEPMEGLMVSKRLGPTGDVERDSHNRFTLDLTDIPPLPEDDWMPPLNTIEWSVIFYYTYADSGDEYWAREGAHWGKDADHLAAPSGPVRQAASGIVSAGDSEETKARKLYAAVMKMQNRDFIVNASATSHGNLKDAAGVLKMGNGSSDEIALLYVALARAAGLKAWPMQVVNRDRATFEPTYLSMSQFDDFIAIVQIDGKDVYLDPGEKMCAFGNLHWKHELAAGFRLTDKGAVIDTTAAGAPKSADVQRTAELAIDEHGSVQGNVRVVMSGQEALYWRQLAQESVGNEVSKQFNEWMRGNLPEGVSVDFDHFDGLENYDANLVATAKLSGTLGSGTGKRLILPGVFFESRGKHPFVEQETRTAPIDLHYAVTEEDDVTYRLPAGPNIDTAPHAVNVSWGDHASLQIRSTEKDGSIHVTRNLVRNSAVFDAGYYTMLRDFYLKMSEADQQQIVLTRSKTDSGS